MCTRYVLLKEHLRELLARLGLEADPNFVLRYNIAPASFVPVVRKPQGRGHEVAPLRWRLVPAWAKSDESATQLVNARAETVASKPSFRDALRQRRCLIPATGFYEWEHRGRSKQPWVFRRRDEQPFAFAGLWESWRAPDGVPLETFAIITTEPNDLMRPIHDRFPVMLAPDAFAQWLDPRVTEPAELAPLLRAPPSETLSAVAVSRHVSNVRHEGPECLAPADPNDDGDANQFSLGLG
jgi:putative SOS response-associated peptidase YedK